MLLSFNWVSTISGIFYHELEWVNTEDVKTSSPDMFKASNPEQPVVGDTALRKGMNYGISMGPFQSHSFCDFLQQLTGNLIL